MFSVKDQEDEGQRVRIWNIHRLYCDVLFKGDWVDWVSVVRVCGVTTPDSHIPYHSITYVQRDPPPIREGEIPTQPDGSNIVPIRRDP